jgi:hypothetical protein
MPLPTTNVPLRLADQCGCPPDPKVLFDFNSTGAGSAHFDVAQGQVVMVEGFSFAPDTVIEFDRIVTLCGQTFMRPALDFCGSAVALTATLPQVLLSLPGRYQARVVAGDIGTFAVAQCPLDMPAHLNLVCDITPRDPGLEAGLLIEDNGGDDLGNLVTP